MILLDDDYYTIDEMIHCEKIQGQFGNLVDVISGT
jgi:hypothetical protein